MRINHPSSSKRSGQHRSVWLSLNVSVLYADQASRDRAATAEAHLTARLAGMLNLHFSWSSLKCLFHLGPFVDATRSLRNADIVLVSISTRANLTLAVRSWIESELGHPNGYPCAVLALLEPTTPATAQPSPVRSFLQEVARHGQLNFVPEVLNWALGRGSRRESGRQMSADLSPWDGRNSVS